MQYHIQKIWKMQQRQNSQKILKNTKYLMKYERFNYKMFNRPYASLRKNVLLVKWAE